MQLALCSYPAWHMQSKALVLPVARVVLGVDVLLPRVHIVQTEALPAEYVPRAQASHAEALPVENVPPWQSAHSEALRAEYAPGAQAEHREALCPENEPAALPRAGAAGTCAHWVLTKSQHSRKI
jgi:hypothetical protein